MIPRTLSLTNFGAIPAAEIDMRDISLAAIVGPNGVGKSTLFTTAPMWALFGVGRSGSSDDVVRSGETACSVSFDFEHQGQGYRVVRTRTVNGRGKTSLELLKETPGGLFESLSGTTIRETEEKIQALLHLDAETFAASSMILQGRANEFTAKAPGQRKAILTQILGLEIYDCLQEGAKERVSKSQRTLERITGSIETARERIHELPAVSESIAAKEAELQDIDTRAAEIEQKIRGTQQELFEAAERFKQSEAVQARVSEIQTRKQRLAERSAELEDTLRRIDGILKDEEAILAGVRQYEETKERLTLLRARAPRREELRRQFRELEQEREELRQENGRYEKEIEEIEAILAEREKIEAARRERDELAARVEQDARDTATLNDLDKKASELRVDIINLEWRREAVEQKIKTCREKVERLEQSGCVALAQAEINPCRFLQDAIEAKKNLPIFTEELNAIEDPTILQTQLQEFEGDIAFLEYDEDAVQERSRRLKEVERLASKIHELEAKERLLKIHLERRKVIARRLSLLEEDLDKIAAEGKTLAAELEPMPQLEAALEKLAACVGKKDELPAFREKRSNTAEQLAALGKETGDLAAEYEKAVHELNTFEATPPGPVEQRLHELEQQLPAIREASTALHAELGVLRAKRSELEAMKEDLKKMEAEKEPLARDLTRWEMLVKAFGRNGIPAFIIENAVPELERISNEILGQMSNGRHNLRFETQRDLKSKAGVAETLDIIVSDWQGARPYETFSGGEQLRIDLAIRIGLAELLANRAGNKIEWLVIDEGLGSQDDEHRETVLQAIQSVAPRFRRTMVITHIKEAQGVFPQVIELARNGAGLEVRVS